MSGEGGGGWEANGKVSSGEARAPSTEMGSVESEAEAEEPALRPLLPLGQRHRRVSACSGQIPRLGYASPARIFAVFRLSPLSFEQVRAKSWGRCTLRPTWHQPLGHWHSAAHSGTCRDLRRRATRRLRAIGVASTREKSISSGMRQRAISPRYSVERIPVAGRRKCHRSASPAEFLPQDSNRIERRATRITDRLHFIAYHIRRTPLAPLDPSDTISRKAGRNQSCLISLAVQVHRSSNRF